MEGLPAHAARNRGEAARLGLATGLRFAAVPLLSLAFVILLVGLLNYYKFQTTFQDVAERRVSMILDRAKSSIESAMDLGLRLEDVGAAPLILGSLTVQDWRVEDAFIFEGAEGRAIFALDPEIIGRPIDPALLAMHARHANGVWRLPEDDRVFLGARLDSAYSDGVGGIALAYSLAELHADAQAMRGELAAAMAATLAIFAGLAFIGLYFLSSEYRSSARNIHRALRDPEKDGELPDELREGLRRFHAVTTQADRELRELEKLAGGTAEPRS